GGRIVLAAHAKPWAGPLRVTDETTGAVLAEVKRPVFMGEVFHGMEAGPQHVWDRRSAMDIRLYAGHLADAEAGAVLAGSNRLAVETDAGDWEVVGFAEVELVAAKIYRLRKLLRGLDGTGPVVGPVSAGRRVVVLDARAGGIAIGAGAIGETQRLRVFARAADVDGQVLELTPTSSP